MDLSGEPKFYPLPGRQLPPTLPDEKQVKRLFDCVYGVGWWRVKYGPKL